MGMFAPFKSLIPRRHATATTLHTTERELDQALASLGGPHV